MCLEVKKQKSKDDWYIRTLNAVSNVCVRSLLEAEIKKLSIG